MLFVLPSRQAAGQIAGKAECREECHAEQKKVMNNLTEFFLKKKLFRKRIAARLFVLKNRKRLTDRLVEICPGIPAEMPEKIYAIMLPFSEENLKNFNRKVLLNFLKDLCREKSSSGFFFPDNLKGIFNETGYDFHMESGKNYPDKINKRLLLKALLPEVLNEIYKPGENILGNLDTLILPGENEKELFECIKQLEPELKFVSIATKGGKELPADIKEYTEENGLSVGIVSDVAEAVGKSDLIISFIDPSLVKNEKLKNGSFFINLNSINADGLRGNGTVINGFTFRFPEKFFRNMPAALLEFFSKDDLTELIFRRLVQGEINSIEHFDEHICLEIIQKKFRETGCRITGFFGRRGKIELTR